MRFVSAADFLDCLFHHGYLSTRTGPSRGKQPTQPRLLPSGRYLSSFCSNFHMRTQNWPRLAMPNVPVTMPKMTFFDMDVPYQRPQTSAIGSITELVIMTVQAMAMPVLWSCGEYGRSGGSPCCELVGEGRAEWVLSRGYLSIERTCKEPRLSLWKDYGGSRVLR